MCEVLDTGHKLKICSACWDLLMSDPAPIKIEMDGPLVEYADGGMFSPSAIYIDNKNLRAAIKDALGVETPGMYEDLKVPRARVTVELWPEKETNDES